MRPSELRGSLFALLGCLGCSPVATPVVDAGPEPDAAIVARGTLGLLAPDLTGAFAPDFEVCVMTPGGACTATSAVGSYTVPVPRESELALRLAPPSGGSLWPWIKPLTTRSVDVNAQFVLMPRPELVDLIVGSPLGRTDGVALVYVERQEGTGLLDRGVAAYAVSASEGTVLYVSSTADSTVPGGTATTMLGLVLITDIPARPWPDGGSIEPTDTITITVTAPAGDTFCTAPFEQRETHNWLRPRGEVPGLASTSLTVEAPIFAGHITYAAYVGCPGL